jgi:hypothetical protein
MLGTSPRMTEGPLSPRTSPQPSNAARPNKKARRGSTGRARGRAIGYHPAGKIVRCRIEARSSASGGALEPRAGAFAGRPCEKQGRIVQRAGLIECCDDITAAKSDIVEHPIVKIRKPVCCHAIADGTPCGLDTNQRSRLGKADGADAPGLNKLDLGTAFGRAHRNILSSGTGKTFQPRRTRSDCLVSCAFRLPADALCISLTARVPKRETLSFRIAAVIGESY